MAQITDSLESKVVDALGTVNKLTDLSTLKAALLVGFIWGVAGLKIADAIAGAKTATIEGGAGLRTDKAPDCQTGK